MAEKSKILIIGGTGYIGKHIVEASAKAGHSTFAMVRECTISDPAKAKLLHKFKTLGVNLVPGDMYHHENLVKAMKQVDVVISSVGHLQLADQVNIITAIKEAGNIKRFFPSDFGNDVDRVHAVEPAKSLFAVKAQIRRTIEAKGIPYTYVSTNSFAGYFLPTFAQPGATAPPPPKHKVIILGDGNPKEAPLPIKVGLAISHSVFVKGDHTNFEIEPSFGVEASELYPDVKYTTVEEYLDKFV
ncbi:Isoflavone reductase protein [Spatholobus suberectus]|nr:Isoflavone reductase protein [Spatholobus suberectus]